MTANYMIKQPGSLILWIILVLSGFSFSADQMTIIEQSETSLRFRITFSQPEIKTQVDQDKTVATISVPDYPTFLQKGKYRIPYYSLLLNIDGNNATTSIVSEAKYSITVPQVQKSTGDVAIDGKGNDIVSQEAERLVTQKVELRKIGSYSGNPLWSADIFPYRYSPGTGELEITSEMVVQIDFPQLTGTAVKPVYDKTFLDDLGVATQSRNSAIPPRTLAKTSVGPVEQWKLLVDKDGIYHVNGQTLIEAGIELNTIDIRNLCLTANGQDVPIYVNGWEDGHFDEEDYFEFWGEYNRYMGDEEAVDIYYDPHTLTSVYRLSWDGRKGAWMGEEGAQVSLSSNVQYVAPISFLDTVHEEKNNYFDRLNTIIDDVNRDHWFYDSGIRSGQKTDYEIIVRDPDPQSSYPLQCRIFMSGRTASSTQPHSAQVYINDSYVYDYQWWGQNIIEMTLEEENSLSGVDLKNGENVLSVMNTNHVEDFDYILFNWVELTYPRLYRAFENCLKFTVPPDYEYNTFLFRIDGFTDSQVDIYKLGYNKMLGANVVEYEDRQENVFYKASFQDVVSSSDVEYVAVTQDAKLVPIGIVEDSPTQLHSTQVAADYVLITHSRFVEMPILDELLELRQSQGLSTLKVDVTDIYDEFNYGKPSSGAIKDFLRYAWQNWPDHSLKYVLFVGDGSYVRYTTANDTLDLVPVHMRQTIKFGAAASDYWYSLLDGDDEIPDISLGRLPVRDSTQVEAIVRKIIDHDQSAPSGDWRNRILFIGGNELLFRNQGMELARTAPNVLDTQMLFTFRDQNMSPDPFFGGTLDLLDYINMGCSIITFHGHGGGAIWADNGLMRIEDAEQLYSQGKFPFFLSMTCFTGSFESPSTESLADALLFTENEGAVAMMGASGYGWKHNDNYLLQEILKYFYEHPDKTIGEIVKAGKIRYYTKYYDGTHTFTEVNHYHLLGDPAMRLKFPVKKVGLKSDTQVLQQGDVLKFESELPFSNGTGRFDLVDSIKMVVDQRNFVVNDGKVSSQFTVGPDFSSKKGNVRMFATNSLGTDQVHGSFSFSLSKVLFDSSRVTMTVDDSVLFAVKVHCKDDIDSVWSVCYNDTMPMTLTGDDWYQSGAFGVRNTSGSLYYYVLVRTMAGEQYRSEFFKHEFQKGPDLIVDANSVNLTGESDVKIYCKIFNYGDQEAYQVPVSLEFNPDSVWVLAGYDTVDVVPALSYSDCEIPVSLPPGNLNFRIHIDPDTLYKDNSRANNIYHFSLNVDQFNFVPGSGIHIGNQVPDTLRWDNDFSMYIPDNLFSNNQVVSIDKMGNPVINEQPDFQVIDGYSAYKIDFPGFTNETQVPITATMTLSDSVAMKLDSLNADYGMFQYSSVAKKWTRLPDNVEQGKVSAQVNKSGAIAVLTCQDSQQPDVQISIDGQPYAYDKFISPQPQFTFVFQDANGIDVESIKVMLNGVEQERQDLAIPDTVVNSNHIVAKLNPELPTGNHSMSIQCRDCNGNIYSSEEMVFKTSVEFTVKMLGNYPNPFTDESMTLFAYMFTIPVESVNLKIYTASGRLIRDLDPLLVSDDPNPLAADYHEILWDAKDMHGNQIANGVYFYKLTVKANGETKKITGKIAKLI